MPKRQIEGSDSLTCSILVLSCDKHRDLWKPFFTLFERYWPDCDWPVYLGTDCDSVDNRHVCSLKAGVGGAWGLRLRRYLSSLDSKYVLLMLEDFFLDRAVSTEAVRAQMELLDRLGGVSMRLFPNPAADYVRDGVGVVHARAAFRVSLQAAIWTREKLISLLVDDESPWAFETEGSRRSRAWQTGFYCVTEPVIHYRHVVERGEWFRDAARHYRACEIGCDFTARTVMGPAKSWKKKRFNELRRLMTKLHSRWLCLARPERA